MCDRAAGCIATSTRNPANVVPMGNEVWIVLGTKNTEHAGRGTAVEEMWCARTKVVDEASTLRHSSQDTSVSDKRNSAIIRHRALCTR